MFLEIYFISLKSQLSKWWGCVVIFVCICFVNPFLYPPPLVHHPTPVLFLANFLFLQFKTLGKVFSVISFLIVNISTGKSEWFKGDLVVVSSTSKDIPLCFIITHLCIDAFQYFPRRYIYQRKFKKLCIFCSSLLSSECFCLEIKI